MIARENFAEKEVNPVVLAFSKDFIVTVAKSEDQGGINFAKERLHKVKVNPPSIVAFYFLDEIVSDHFTS